MSYFKELGRVGIEVKRIFMSKSHESTSLRGSLFGIMKTDDLLLSSDAENVLEVANSSLKIMNIAGVLSIIEISTILTMREVLVWIEL